MSSEQSIERAILETVAFHAPIDGALTRRLAGECVGRELGYDGFNRARDNLMELGLISRPGPLGSVYLHIESDGWRILGGSIPGESGVWVPETVVY